MIKKLLSLFKRKSKRSYTEDYYGNDLYKYSFGYMVWHGTSCAEGHIFRLKEYSLYDMERCLIDSIYALGKNFELTELDINEQIERNLESNRIAFEKEYKELETNVRGIERR